MHPYVRNDYVGGSLTEDTTCRTPEAYLRVGGRTKATADGQRITATAANNIGLIVVSRSIMDWLTSLRTTRASSELRRYNLQKIPPPTPPHPSFGGSKQQHVFIESVHYSLLVNIRVAGAADQPQSLHCSREGEQETKNARTQGAAERQG